ncbi:DSBA-like thioredoxin domain-containing protein [Parathielavia appendiculata]|uniref:DSBA-like thioredoxin domain-containing protein n=1 Tax=Parathielavia appendiculata TaxID=2587402 RepID=A0AAN6Z3J7_9PEZI|nr:DSBA-like thioredoxin domain-containing protein [Parathielavia appendiculata]
MGGKIDCYVDIASLYSYLAFLELQKNRDLLASQNVQVEYHPFLLGGINAGSGNRPPWTVRAKAKYLAHDARRSIARHDPLPPPISFPRDLMQRGMTVVPMRCLLYIKRRYPAAVFDAVLHYLFHLFWSPPNMDLTTPESVAKALVTVPRGFRGPGTGIGEGQGGRLFTEAEVREIVEGALSEEIKVGLKSTTQEALDKGAFGAPWLWVVDERTGRGEPFFGSDRFHFVYKFLGLPYTDVTLLPAAGAKAKL